MLRKEDNKSNDIGTGMNKFLLIQIKKKEIVFVIIMSHNKRYIYNAIYGEHKTLPALSKKERQYPELYRPYEDKCRSATAPAVVQ